MAVGVTAPKLRDVNVIEVHCNLVDHSLVQHDIQEHKHDETELPYQYFANVSHGYKISKEPQKKLCTPLRKVYIAS